jgi:hypothetical protein
VADVVVVTLFIVGDREPPNLLLPCPPNLLVEDEGVVTESVDGCEEAVEVVEELSA